MRCFYFSGNKVERDNSLEKNENFSFFSFFYVVSVVFVVT